MKKLLLSLILLVGCGTPGYIKASAIEDTVRNVVKRHDAYVEQDKTLKPLEKRIYKRDGLLLLEALKEAQKPTEEPEEK